MEEGGHFILVQPIWPMHQNKTFLDFFILVHQKALISWSAEAWDPESVSWHCTRMKISRKFKFSCTIQGHCTRIKISRIFLFWCKKKVQGSACLNFFLALASWAGSKSGQKASQPASQPASHSKQASESWRPAGRLEGRVWGGGSLPRE